MVIDFEAVVRFKERPSFVEKKRHNSTTRTLEELKESANLYQHKVRHEVESLFNCLNTWMLKRTEVGARILSKWEL